jgi:putative two-component system response regulator
MSVPQSTHRILIVEDDETLANVLQRILQNAQLGETRVVTDSRQALPVFREWSPDLVLMDLRMPHMDGIAVMQQLRSRSDADEFLPVIMITGDAAPETRDRALRGGASDFLTKPFESAEVRLRVQNLLNLRGVQAALRAALTQSRQQLEDMQKDLVTRLTTVARHRNPGSSSDPTRVGQLSAHIAHALGLPADEVDLIRQAAPLHDIGMIGMPEQIAAREGIVSLEELDTIRSHTSAGASILGNSELPVLQLAEEIALYHHESWDGNGYTPGLAGASIPLAARIVAVADTFCAMTDPRPYQNPSTPDAAVAWIESQAGTRFDPAVVEAFKRVCALNDLPVMNNRSGGPQSN